MPRGRVRRRAETWASTWSRRTWSPVATSRRTTPPCGARTGCSIFMASMVTMRSPAATVAPSATWSATTAPGIGARSSGSVAAASRSRSARRFSIACRRVRGRRRWVAPSAWTQVQPSRSVATVDSGRERAAGASGPTRGGRRPGGRSRSDADSLGPGSGAANDDHRRHRVSIATVRSRPARSRASPSPSARAHRPQPVRDRWRRTQRPSNTADSAAAPSAAWLGSAACTAASGR